MQSERGRDRRSVVLLMLSAFFMAHVPQGWIPIQNGGEMALLFALIVAFVASRGSGPLSLDRHLGRSLGRAGTGHSSNSDDTHHPT